MTPPEPIWASTVDEGKYHASVDRVGAYAGVLIVKRAEDGEVLLRKEVGLSFQAVFGPDMDDVLTWQEMALEVIDNDTDNTESPIRDDMKEHEDGNENESESTN